MKCTRCGADNADGRKFCLDCGAALTQACRVCGTGNEPGAKFCGECGTRLEGPGVPAEPARPVAERRVVSVLFADLVGFTNLSDTRDAEDVRDVLSHYFDSSRRLIERYGGVVEKFIGDAVMAVWGARTANEDDAERAVRAALDLVASVTALGEQLALPGLHLRAGVLTGEAAVTVGAEGEGMVAGDIVNTASRIQALAAPGTVLVGDSTRRAAEASIAFEDAGTHQVKGKPEPLHLFRPLRVVAARRGEGRNLGFEPPFVGREREFRLVTEAFHDCAQERRSRLVSVIGVAGVGKSRLSWEFEKHIDGLAFDVLWHRGRCLAYGENVAFWALGEMIRMRGRIAENDPPDIALTKLAEMVEGAVPDEAERAFLEPRLAHLLGLADRTAPDKEDLFSGWRLFFERLADRAPVVLVFEDLQWADAALLDFIDYLLDWSRTYPIYVLGLARPEFSERWPAFAAGQRDFTSLQLEPLTNHQVDELLDAGVPGLPDELRSRIVERAEGVPLYAVETVRMLVNRGLLIANNGSYRAVGRVDDLDVPETLHALAAARLDSLDSEERTLLGDAAVLGRTFHRAGLTALSGLEGEGLDRLLHALVRKEILTVQVDPMSPERGQYSFIQELLRRVAYDTLSLRERKQKHLAAAAHLSAQDGEDEISPLLATHYLDAFRAGPTDPDAAELKERARLALSRAGERSISLAAAGEAWWYFRQAAELADDPSRRADLLEQAGRAATQNGEHDTALSELQEAIRLLGEVGERRHAARVEARLADVLRWQGRIAEAVELMRDAYNALVDGPADRDLALVAAQYGRLAYFAGDEEEASDPVEMAIEIGEALEFPEPLAEALNTKACLLYRRSNEAEALLMQSLKVAMENGLTSAALRAQFNLSGLYLEHDRLDLATVVLEEALALAHRRGDRSVEQYTNAQLADVQYALGNWDAAAAVSHPVDEPWDVTETVGGMAGIRIRLSVGRGDVADARVVLDAWEQVLDAGDLQEQGSILLGRAAVLRAEGNPRAAVAELRRSMELWRRLRQMHYLAEAHADAVDAAFELGDQELVEELLAEAETLPAIDSRPLLRANQARFRGRLAALRGLADEAEQGFSTAISEFRRLDMQFNLAVALVEQAEWLADAGRAEEAAASAGEARDLFVTMGAAPWVQRASLVPEAVA
jgi:class 3 adenylate cyclase/tetratricopeptide (TPR) repeat protein